MLLEAESAFSFPTRLVLRTKMAVRCIGTILPMILWHITHNITTILWQCWFWVATFVIKRKVLQYSMTLLNLHDRCLWLPDNRCKCGDRRGGAYDLPTRGLVVPGLRPGEELGHQAFQHLRPRQHAMHRGGGDVNPSQRTHRATRRYSTCPFPKNIIKKFNNI